MPTEVYCTRANTLPVKEVWMVSDVYGKIKKNEDWLIKWKNYKSNKRWVYIFQRDETLTYITTWHQLGL